MADRKEHEPHGRHQSKKAAASGWIGSALEYYDFFIYATAASLIFPQLFFPSGNPTVAIVAKTRCFRRTVTSCYGSWPRISQNIWAKSST